jgi:arginyl-tRNA synthetase
MYLFEELQLIISRALKLDRANFSYPPQASLGDLSLACFELAQDRKINPVELAKQLALSLQTEPTLKACFTEVRAVGPYLNFFIAPEYLAKEVISRIKRDKFKYGTNTVGGQKVIMIEYSNGNTHKEYHVGHLRNISYGDAINHLLASNGYQIVPVSYVNDFGIHVAKTIWNWRRNQSYQHSPEAKGYLLGQCYAEASQVLTVQPELKPEVAEIMKNIESRCGVDYALWTETRQWSIDYFAAIYRELGIKFTEIFYESEVVERGLGLVEELKAKGVLKLSQGAIIADLESYGLGVLPFIRTDGTALYPVGDLALASEKFSRYHLDESIYVIDVRQSLYFKQLFKVLELIDYRPAVKHLDYDFVTLPSGMMSSRTGNIITYQYLKDKIFTKLLAETQKRHPDWNERRTNQIVERLTISIIKFEMLKVGAAKTITFNIDEAMRFDGYTACYLQYTYARLQSLVRKAGFSYRLGLTKVSLLSESLEKELLIKLAKYPNLVREAGEKYDPSELTKYLFELSQLFNDYYHQVNILKAAASVKRARLALIKSVDQVLGNGCQVLGLQLSPEM